MLQSHFSERRHLQHFHKNTSDLRLFLSAGSVFPPYLLSASIFVEFHAAAVQLASPLIRYGPLMADLQSYRCSRYPFTDLFRPAVHAGSAVVFFWRCQYNNLIGGVSHSLGYRVLFRRKPARVLRMKKILCGMFSCIFLGSMVPKRSWRMKM